MYVQCTYITNSLCLYAAFDSKVHDDFMVEFVKINNISMYLYLYVHLSI